MKKILFILILFISISGYSQAFSKYQRLGKLTSTQRDAIDVSDTSMVYVCYNTTTNQEEINKGSGWVARNSGGGGSASDFSEITGSARDNASLSASLDSTVHKFNPETIDGAKTLLQTLDITAEKITKTEKSQYRPLIKVDGTEFINFLTERWNGTSFQSTNGFGIGRQAIGNNKGKEVTAVGDYALENNTGDQATAVGNSALQNNTGGVATALGYLAGQYSTGTFNPLYLGSYAGRYASGTSNVFVGHNNGTNNKGSRNFAGGSDAMNTNTGNDGVGVGHFSMRFNGGNDNNGIGRESIYSGLGSRNNALGNYSLKYIAGNDNNVLGYNSFSELLLNPSGAKSFTSGDVTTGTDRISISAHGFGITNAIVNLKYTGTSLGTGLETGTINKWKVIDANTIESYGVDVTSVGSGTMTFTPQLSLNNVNIVGNNLQPTISNQTILGGNTVIAPNSVKADVVAGGNKVLLTREAADQLYTGGGGGGSITLPLDATDIADGTISNTEFQYLDGATSNLQDQINLKADAGYIYDLTGGTTGLLMAKASDDNGDFEWKSITDYLNNTLTSTSTLLGLTAAKGKELQDTKFPYTGGTITGITNIQLTGYDYGFTASGFRLKANALSSPNDGYFMIRRFPLNNNYDIVTPNGITSSGSSKIEFVTVDNTVETGDPTAVVAIVKGRMKGEDGIDSDDYATVGQLVGGLITGADIPLTGYTKPGSTSAVSATDNVNEAIGKLEKAADDMIAYKMDPRTGSETLVSADILPTATRQKAVWMTYSTNDTITLDNTLPIGVPFILEAGADSLMVKRDAGTIKLIGESDTLIRVSDDIDGIIIPGGRSVTGIKKASNLYRFDGMWTVRDKEESFPLTAENGFKASYYAQDLGAASSSVNIWSDRAGANDAVQATSGNQPTVVIESDGKKAVKFDGTDDFLTITEVPALDFAPGSPISMVLVIGPATLTDDQFLLFKGSTASSVTGPEYGFRTSGNSVMGNTYGSESGDIAHDAKVNVFIVTSDGSTSKMYKDGVLQSTWSVGTRNQSSNIFIGSRNGSKYLSTSIRAIGISNVELTPLQRGKIDTYDW